MTWFHADTHGRARAVAALAAAAVRQAAVDPFLIGNERPSDANAREALLDRSFGTTRFRKTCERLRVGRLPAGGLSLVARLHDGFEGSREMAPVIGTVRLWHVDAGGVPALMLGPLAVDARYRCFGIGSRLMEDALARASALGHGALLLVGDAPYYARFGFDRRHTQALRMPGPVEASRFLGLELVAGAFASAKGMVRATGAYDLGARSRAPRSKLTVAA